MDGIFNFFQYLLPFYCNLRKGKQKHTMILIFIQITIASTLWIIGGDYYMVLQSSPSNDDRYGRLLSKFYYYKNGSSICINMKIFVPQNSYGKYENGFKS